MAVAEAFASALRGPGRLAAAGVTSSVRLAGLTGRAAAAPTRAAVAAAQSVRSTPTARHARGRQVWAVRGRAQVEVRGLLGGPAGTELAQAVEAAVDELPGMAWARVDRVTGKLVARFDANRVGVEDIVDAVQAAEQAAGVGDRRRADHVDLDPGATRPVHMEALALAADLAGLSAAALGLLARLPALPGGAAAAVVLVDNQPRLRELLERRLGPSETDLALAVSSAAVHGLTHGVVSLAVDTALRGQALAAARARLSAFTAREAELHGPGRPSAAAPVEGGGRPVPVPSGPVETLADRAAAASLLAAAAAGTLGGLSPVALNLAGQAVLIGAPKAARSARDAFCDRLTVGLSRAGSVVIDPAALRRMDRITTVLVDGAVLVGDRPLVVDASTRADSWSREHVWSAAQRVLDEQRRLPVPPPGRRRHRLTLTADPDVAEQSADADGLLRHLLLVEDGRPVGAVTVGRELDPLADAVLGAARAAASRLVLVEDPNAAELSGRVDEIVARRRGLAALVRGWQRDGQVVAVVSSDERLLAAADLAVGVIPAAGRVPWTADVLAGPGLTAPARVLSAVPAARSVSHRGVTLAVGASFLGALLAAVGSGRRGGATLPVNLAAASGMVVGTRVAGRVFRAPAPTPVQHTPWHALDVEEVLQRIPPPPAVDTRADLDARVTDADTALTIAGARPSPAWRSLSRFAGTVRAELNDPLTPVLATGAAASAVIGSATDALLVGGVLGANAVVSGLQRLRAEQAVQALLADQSVPAHVLTPAAAADDVRHGSRTADGAVTTVAAGRLRVGDVVELRAGDVVPADCRLLRENGLEIDEASLTGESIAVAKQVEATPGAELADRACMAYEGTSVLTGSAVALVVAVGPATEAGRAVALAAHAAGPAGMQARLEQLTRRGLPITLLGGAAVTALGLLRGQTPRAAIGSGVSVAVAAVPEGLPLVATVAQLSAARRLSQRGVLVRSARTVEALGRVDTVCFDKTGTLTRGTLTLVRAAGLEDDWPLTHPAARRVLRAAARACPRPEPGEPLPHATDRAVLDGVHTVLGDDFDADWDELAELPFHSERGFSAALGRVGGGRLRLVVKGAPESLLPRCTHVRDEQGKRALDRAARGDAERMVAQLAGQGLRVLAVARRSVPPSDTGLQPLAADTDTDADSQRDTDHDTEQLADELTLLGFVGLADVARPEAAATIAELRAAGLSPVMITGDHPVTARAIATELGIPAATVVTGAQLAGQDERRRAATVRSSSVFARVSPEQKLQIIAALQSAGRTVAMTGDGTNDAAAIRLADVGIGMTAHGSTAARRAADLVFTRPDLSLVLPALIEGRAMWRRVRDAVAILLGGNAGEVSFTLAGTALTGRAPLGTRQFLLVNMLTDLLPAMAIALAATPTDTDERREILHRGTPSLGAPLVRDIAIRGAATATGALAAWQIGVLTGRRRRADTMALAALVGTQLGQTLAVGGRTPLVAATGLGSAVALAAIIQTPGVSQFFGCTPLGPVAWGTTVASAAGATALAVLAPQLLPSARTPHRDEPTTSPAETTPAPARTRPPVDLRPV